MRLLAGTDDVVLEADVSGQTAPRPRDDSMTSQTLQPPTTEPRQDPPLLLLLPGYLCSATKFLVFPRAPVPGSASPGKKKGSELVYGVTGSGD